MTKSLSSPLRERLRREPWLTLFLTVDATVYFALLFRAIDSFLLWRDGAYSLGAGTARILLAVGGIGFLAWANPLRETMARARGWRGRIPWDAAILVGIALALTLATSAASRKRQSFLWLAGEWHKIPANFELIVRLSPVIAPLIALGFLAAIWVAAFGRAGRAASAALLSVGLAYAVYATATIGAGGRIVFYLVVYGLPMVVAAVSAARGARRLAARATVVSLFLTLLLTHYVAHLPWMGLGRTPKGPGLEKLYPPPGEEPSFPLAFLRDFVVDEKRGYLFSAYGPTSGLIRLDLKTHELQIIPTEIGMVRSVVEEPGSDLLRALDWINGDLLTLTRDPFTVQSTIDLTGKRFFTPYSLCATRERLYVVSSEWPGLIEVEIDGDAVRPGRSIDFAAAGLTQMRSGAWDSSLWQPGRSLFVELGMINSARDYLLLRVDLDRFQVTEKAPIPHGGEGLWLEVVPEKGSVLTAGFFTDLFCEFDVRTLALKRTFAGVLGCRNAVYDPARDLIYAEGFLTGSLTALRYSDAAPVRRLWIGKRALSLAFVPESDALYLGSSQGIYRLDLSEWVGPKPTRGHEPSASNPRGPSLQP